MPPFHFVCGPSERRHGNMPLHHRFNIRALAGRVNQIAVFIDEPVKTILVSCARAGRCALPNPEYCGRACLLTRNCGLSLTSICGKLTLMRVSFGQSRLSNSSSMMAHAFRQFQNAVSTPRLAGEQHRLRHSDRFNAEHRALFGPRHCAGIAIFGDILPEITDKTKSGGLPALRVATITQSVCVPVTAKRFGSISITRIGFDRPAMLAPLISPLRKHPHIIGESPQFLPLTPNRHQCRHIAKIRPTGLAICFPYGFYAAHIRPQRLRNTDRAFIDIFNTANRAPQSSRAVQRMPKCVCFSPSWR